jgi:hypothetical protein
MEQSVKADRTIADMRLDLSRANAELRVMHKHCADLSARLQNVQQLGPINSSLRDQLAAQIACNQALLNSTSWKITRPLRAIVHLLRAS